MKRRSQFRIQKIIAVFLLAAVSIFITPKELIHGFFHHEDTVDISCSDGCEGHLGNEHQHCDVLQLSTPPLFFQVTGFSFSSIDLLCNVSVDKISSYQFVSSPFLFFRGPPTIV